MKLSQYIITFAAAAVLIVSTTTTGWSYRQNHTCEDGRNACEDDAKAKPIVWDRSCVLFYIDKDGSDDFPSGPDGQEALSKIVQDSFETWRQPACAGFKPVYGGMIDPMSLQDGERRNVVSFKQEGWAEASAMTFATTIVNYNPRTGTIREASIEVNDQFYELATGSMPGPGEADLQNTLTHEIGHFLGMAHSNVEDATMYGSAGLGETKKRTLHQDDVEGLCAYYPASEYTGSCGEDPDQDSKADDGSDSITWGADEDGPSSGAACSVTRPHVTTTSVAGMMSTILLMMGLFGGVLWRRRTRSSNGV